MTILIRGLLAVVLALAQGVAGLAAGGQAGSLDEAEAKASFLYNLTLFAEWPDAEARARAPFAICVMGATPVSPALRRYAGQVIHGRPLEVRDVREGGVTDGCEIVFMPTLDARRLAAALASLSGQPVVTVGEADGFLQAGGMLRIGIARARLRFDVDLEPAERAGIKFSPRLLALAATVRRHGDPIQR